MTVPAAPRPVAMELIAQSPADVRVAVDIGATRVELCQALALGGLTPSIATVEHAVAAASGALEVHVLIRCRPGGFHYSDEEVAVMASDIHAAVAAGAAGVVVGCLDATGRFDRDQMLRLRDATQGAGFCAHRAIDVSSDPLVALEELITLGAERVLTSGAAASAEQGAATLAKLVSRSAGRIEIMAGGGVSAASVPLLLHTGVGSIHFSAKRTLTARAAVSVGVGSAESYEQADPDAAAEIAAAVRAFVAGRA